MSVAITLSKGVEITQSLNVEITQSDVEKKSNNV